MDLTVFIKFLIFIIFVYLVYCMTYGKGEEMTTLGSFEDNIVDVME